MAKRPEEPVWAATAVALPVVSVRALPARVGRPGTASHRWEDPVDQVGEQDGQPEVDGKNVAVLEARLPVHGNVDESVAEGRVPPEGQDQPNGDDVLPHAQSPGSPPRPP